MEHVNLDQDAIFDICTIGIWQMTETVSGQADTAVPANPTEKDKRNSPRCDLERPVQIVLADGPSITCALSDVSRSGARIYVSDPAALPDEFEIVLKDDIRKWCRVMRRLDKHVGVKFIARSDTAPQAPSIVPESAASQTAPPTTAKAATPSA